MTENFEFESEGRTYVCSLEAAHPSRDEPWWWFSVSGDRYRYAPFRAEPGDTKNSVQKRILAYHTAMLVRKATVVPYRPFRTR